MDRIDMDIHIVQELFLDPHLDKTDMMSKLRKYFSGRQRSMSKLSMHFSWRPPDMSELSKTYN